MGTEKAHELRGRIGEVLAIIEMVREELEGRREAMVLSAAEELLARAMDLAEEIARGADFGHLPLLRDVDAETVRRLEADELAKEGGSK